MVLRARTHIDMRRRIALVVGGTAAIAAGVATRRGFGTRTGQLGLPTRHRGRSEHAGWSIWCDSQSPCTPRGRSAGVSRARGSSAAGVLGWRPLRAGPRSEPAMTAHIARMVRLCVAGVLATFPFCAAPPASAVTPPAVDDSMLPKPGPPAPPRPTEQQERCVAAPPTTRRHSRCRPAEGPRPAASLEVHARSRADCRRHRYRRGTPSTASPSRSRRRLRVHRATAPTIATVTAQWSRESLAQSRIPTDRRSAVSHPTPRSSAFVNPATNSAPTDDPSGSGFGDVDTLASAVRTAADMGATVINVSSVACLPTDGGLDDRPLGAALAYAVDVKNVVVVAAAGNVGGPGQCPEQNPATDPARPGQPDWDRVSVVVSPAWYDDYVLTVGSVDVARGAVIVQSGRAVGGCRSAGRRHRVVGSRR